MKPRVRVWRVPRSLPSERPSWVAECRDHEHEHQHVLVVSLGWPWEHTLAAANAHANARTHARTDIASFLALRDDHPASDRRWDTPLSHDLPEPPC